MRSEEFSFYIWGSAWGLTCVRVSLLLVFAMVRNCPQPSACSRCGRKVAVSMGKAAKTSLSQFVRRCGHVVLPCLGEKSQKRVFLDVLEDVVMSFCVAGVVLCDIPRV